MKTRGPVGACRYCGQEFMRRQSLENHEADLCTKRPFQDHDHTSSDTVGPESQTTDRRWRQVNRIGGGIGWIRDEDG